MSFTHLHVHCRESLLDGISKREDLVKLCKQHNMNAVAFTEHGNLTNMISAYKLGKENNIQVVAGLEAYVAPDLHTNRTYSKVDDEDKGDLSKSAYHLTILAKNNTGYRNLSQLSTISNR